jgi:opacity protein-like surface antigen
MDNMNRIALALILLLCSQAALAAAPAQPVVETPYTRWVIGLALSRIAEDASVFARDMHAFAASVGYRYRVMDRIYAIPEVRFAYSLGADSTAADQDPASNALIVFDDYVSVSVRGVYEAENGFYGYLAPTWGYFGYMLSLAPPGYEAPDMGRDRGLGLGLGGGYRFKSNIALELGLEIYESRNLFNLGVRFHY